MVAALWITVPVTVAGLAGAALVATVGRRVVRPQRSRPTRVLAIPAPDRIVLSSTAITRQDGTLGLLYDEESQHAVLGPIVQATSDPAGVERPLTVAPGAAGPAVGSLTRPVGNVFATAHALDPRATEVSIDTELGSAPAWLFPGTGDATSTWAIHVHGILSGRDAAFRSVHAIAGTGVTSLVPSTRGDGDGPAAPLDAFTLGQTEWRDVDAAIAFALAQGAQRVVLIGWSSGASISLRLAASSAHRAAIAGLVLVSPVLSWRSSVLYSAANAGIPRFIAAAAVAALSTPLLSRLLGSPVPLNFRELDWTGPATALAVPALVIHSEGDQTTPFADTRTFSDTHPSVTLVVTEPASHALEWNADPGRFEAAVHDWYSTTL